MVVVCACVWRARASGRGTGRVPCVCKCQCMCLCLGVCRNLTASARARLSDRRCRGGTMRWQTQRRLMTPRERGSGNGRQGIPYLFSFSLGLFFSLSATRGYRLVRCTATAPIGALGVRSIIFDFAAKYGGGFPTVLEEGSDRMRPPTIINTRTYGGNREAVFDPSFLVVCFL